MAPGKWDDEESDSTPPSSPPIIARRGKFDDEEDEEEVLDTWSDAEDSEVEREKAKKEAEAKAKKEAEAKANHLTGVQRREKAIAEKKKRLEEEDDESDDETEEEKRLRLRQQEKEADLNNAVDLFGDLDGERNRKRAMAVKPVVLQEGSDPTNAIDLSALPIFKVKTKTDFNKMRDVLVPLISANAKNASYPLFLQEFVKELAKELPSEHIRKAGTVLSTLSNEKMREEKAAEKGGKKTKAAKNKTSLNANRDVAVKADTATYDEDFGDDDFM